MQLSPKDLQRFGSKIGTTGSCHEWTGYKDADGYGRLHIGGKKRLAHRVAFHIENGYRPKVVRHTCDNPGCVNPEHLKGGTQRDNIRDRQRRDRQAKGSRNGRSKLKAEDVRELRRLKRETNRTYKQLAEEYGVSHYTVKDAVLGKTWSHI